MVSVSVVSDSVLEEFLDKPLGFNPPEMPLKVCWGLLSGLG